MEKWKTARFVLHFIVCISGEELKSVLFFKIILKQLTKDYSPR